MDSEGQARAPYVVPRYRADVEPAWYHVLHGTVPGHQIDFIYSPEVPQGALNQTHLAHVARLVKHIEPREQTSFAFAIGNLSRDDIQHEPGHGGLALIFGLRVEGVVDHASRAMPPYAHGVLAVDRSLDFGILLDAIFAFYRRFFGDAPTEAAGSFYRSYVHTMETAPEEVERFLREYTEGFTELPRSKRSQLGCEFFATEDTKLHRITIVHGSSVPFDAVAEMAATLGSILYRSDVKWTSISNGREVEIPGGVSVRFVPESDAPRDSKGLVLRLEEIPRDEAQIAEKLFGARPKAAQAAPRMGWREQAAARAGKGRVGTLPPGKNALMATGPMAAAPAPAPVVVPAPVKQSSPRLRETAAAAVPAEKAVEPVAAAAAAAVSVASDLEASRSGEVEVDDEAPTRSAGFEPEPSVDVSIDEVAPTLNAGLEPEPVAPTLIESPPPPPPVAAAASAVGAVAAVPEAGRPVGSSPRAPAVERPPPRQLSAPVTDARASVPDDAASLDAVPPMKPGKGRWLVLGAVVAALVVGIFVLGSGAGSGGAGPSSGESPSSGRPASGASGATSTQGATASQPGVGAVPSSGSSSASAGTSASSGGSGTSPGASSAVVSSPGGASPATTVRDPALPTTSKSTSTSSSTQVAGGSTSGGKGPGPTPAPGSTKTSGKKPGKKGILDDDTLDR